MSHATDFIVAGAHLPTVGRSVDSILAQSCSDLVGTVWVGGRDVHGVLPDDARVRTLDDLPAGPACIAYNAALERSRAPFVAIVDGDCVLAPDWLHEVRRAHADGWDGVAGGLVVTGGPYRDLAYNYGLFHEVLASLPPAPRSYLPTMNLGVRRAAVESAGRFRTDMARMYDFEWTLRLTLAGHRLCFHPAARVTHHPCGIDARVLWRTWHAGGACSQEVRRRHPDLIRSSRLLEHPRWLRLLAPAVAVWATGRIVARHPMDAHLWMVSPVLWATRVAWCLGAAHGRRHGPTAPAAYPVRVPGT